MSGQQIDLVKAVERANKVIRALRGVSAADQLGALVVAAVAVCDVLGLSRTVLVELLYSCPQGMRIDPGKGAA